MSAIHKKLPAHIEREIAVAAKTDPRTVANVVAGKPTRASTRERILTALHGHAEAKKYFSIYTSNMEGEHGKSQR